MKRKKFLRIIFLILVVLAFLFSYLLYEGFSGEPEESNAKIIEIKSPEERARVVALEAYDSDGGASYGVEKSKINEDYIVTINEEESGDRVDLVVREGEVYAYSVNYGYLKRCSVFYDGRYCS